MPKRKTLSDFLQEYESQTERFRDHTGFQGFCKIQVEKRKQQVADRFLLSTFEGSPTCSAGAWVRSWTPIFSSTIFLKMRPSYLQ